jgi:hypothetical protein
MLALRDAEYGNYRKNKNQYGGKSYRPKKEKGGGNGNGNGKGKGRGNG